MDQEPKRQFSLEELRLEDVPAMRKMHAKSWLATYPNDAAGVSREWVEERVAAWLTDEELAKSKEYFRDITQNPDHFYRVARDQDRVVGLVHASRIDGHQELHALYIDEDYYGNGLAQELIDAALQHFDMSQDIELQVAAYNERAKSFYRKYGFEEVQGSETLFKEKIPIITMRRDGDKS